MVRPDDWLLAKNLITKIFSRSSELLPTLASGFDDLLYELNRSEELGKNLFCVLINITFLINKLIQEIDQAKFLMCFSPNLFWQEPELVEEHFENFDHV